MKNLFLISSSSYQNGGIYTHCFASLKKFLGPASEHKNIVVFIPYANADKDYDGYTEKMAEPFKKMGYDLIGIHQYQSPQQCFYDKNVVAICIGGGNTWLLADILNNLDLMKPIKERVESGDWKYIGASAGTVIACNSILTTNDMATVFPLTDKGLGLLPFQINPHFVPGSLVDKHMGEPREERVRQVLLHNPEWQIVGLPEGCWIKGEGEKFTLYGAGEAVTFRIYGNNSKWLVTEEYESIGML